MTKEEIKEAVRQMNMSPTDLFSDEVICATEPAKKSKQTEYEHAKRVEEKLGKVHEENSKLQGVVAKLEGEKTSLLEKAKVGQAKEVFGTLAAEKKLDPNFQKFVEKNIGSFKSDKEGEDFKLEMDTFITKQAKEYKEHAELFGAKDVKITVESEEGEEGKDDKGKKGARSGDAGKKETDDDDEEVDELEDPEKNEFIPA